MRKIYTAKAISALLISIILSSCSSKNLLTMSVTEPAPVYIPSEIKTIGIIDRSMPAEKNATMDQIDKILSFEGKNLDKDGARQTVVGLFDELVNSDDPRATFKTIRDEIQTSIRVMKEVRRIWVDTITAIKKVGAKEFAPE